MANEYERIGILSLEEVLPFVQMEIKGQKRTSKTYFGEKVWLSSTRYNMFAQKGCTCVSCGIEGKFFAIERHINQNDTKLYHLNLYGIDEAGEEVLMTQDHIIPKSKGGGNCLNNLQPMCEYCNQLKKDNILIEMIL